MFPYARCLLVLLLGACVDLSRPTALVMTDPTGGTSGQGGAGGGGGRGGDGGGSSGGTVGTDTGEPPADMLLPDADPVLDGALMANGQRCSEAGQCVSGFCSDGFCCDGGCAGTCQSCGLSGMEGSCQAVPAGQDPRNQCAEEPLVSCGQDGHCNGQGACGRYAAGTVCVAGRCAMAVEYAASTCDGNGVCNPGSSRSCSPNVCTGSSCAGSCTASSDCQAGFFCEASKCAIQRAKGAACTVAGQCASNHCVDGYCCDGPCTSTCRACNVAGAAGTCTAIAAGQDPGSECPAEAASTCGRAGGCNGAGACRLHAAGVPCQGKSCSGFVETAARTCNGAGVCGTASTRDCTPYVCGSGACSTTCTSTSQCRAGHYCSAGACVAFGAGPILHWKFDEANGSIAQDASGNGHVGTYIGASGAPAASAQVPPGSFTNAFSRAFVANAQQAVRLAPAPAALKPTASMTISLWFRTTRLDLGHDPPAASEALSLGDNYFIRVRAADVTFTRFTSSSYATCFAPATTHLNGNWHHVVGVLSAAGMKVYLDGVERCSNTRGDATNFSKGPDLYVGRHGQNDPDWDFDGNIDDVRIYNRAMPADEVAALAAGF